MPPKGKPFLTYEQQINKLKNEKSLKVSNQDDTISILKRTSYFALICGYKQLFKDKSTNKYKMGTSFYDIVDLYKFDQNVRLLFFSNILKIERHIKSIISYYFTEQFGDTQDKYLDENNYDNLSYNKSQVQTFIQQLNVTLNPPYGRPSEYEYINHHKKEYRNVPLWVIINALTFGNISKMYSFSKQSLKIKISKEFYGVNEKTLGDMLNILSKYRNVCAHNERLFNYKTRKSLPDLNLHKELKIDKIGTLYKFGKTYLFSVAICFRYLLSHEDFRMFYHDLKKQIKIYSRKLKVLNLNDILNEMGFPLTWNKIEKAHLY